MPTDTVRSAWAVIVAFGAVAGFMVSIMVYRTNAMDDRIRAIEVRQAQMWCTMNPEACVKEMKVK